VAFTAASIASHDARVLHAWQTSAGTGCFDSGRRRA
jgi:hypothetical protein